MVLELPQTPQDLGTPVVALSRPIQAGLSESLACWQALKNSQGCFTVKLITNQEHRAELRQVLFLEEV